MVRKEKKNTKSQSKKTVCEIVNFGLTKLTKKKSRKTTNGTTFS